MYLYAREAFGSAVGFEVWATDPAVSPQAIAAAGAKAASPDELLENCEAFSLHLPLTPETKGLIDAEKLSWMKPTAVLVNTSRGPVVDGVALADALKAGTIFGAGLDVTDPEPIPMDSPLVGLENCLIVPHIASASRATRGKMAEMAAANLLAGVRGERIPTPVNPEVYDRT